MSSVRIFRKETLQTSTREKIRKSTRTPFSIAILTACNSAQGTRALRGPSGAMEPSNPATHRRVSLAGSRPRSCCPQMRVAWQLLGNVRHRSCKQERTSRAGWISDCPRTAGRSTGNRRRSESTSVTLSAPQAMLPKNTRTGARARGRMGQRRDRKGQWPGGRHHSMRIEGCSPLKRARQ